jgi:transcription initiation factor TFIID subunit TAF12
MAALASLATLVGAGASVYGNVRQAQQQNTLNKAQVQIAQQQEAARQQALLAQQQQDAQQRALTLAKTIATTRARLAASGVAPDAGSAGALTAGLTQEAAAAQTADDATLRARLAQGRVSLLNPDGTFTALLQSGRTFGFATRSLLD